MEIKHSFMHRPRAMPPGLCRFAACALAAGIAGACLIGSARGQSLSTPDSEEQRRRSQAQASERERLRQAPNVDLQGERPGDTDNNAALPASAPCFTIRHIRLETPSRLPPAIRAAGASALPQDPLRFAQDHARRYEGLCLGTAAIEEVVRRWNGSTGSTRRSSRRQASSAARSPAMPRCA